MIPDADTAKAISRESQRLLADGLALVYHEARHVRHLVRGGHLSPAGWERLLSLPTNRVEAWREIQTTRQAAAGSVDVAQAISGFEDQFRKSLADLAELYANVNWRHATAVGGHAWRAVTDTVIMLRDAVGQGGNIAVAADALVRSRHNNGVVREKIVGLDSALGLAICSWWIL